MRFYADVQGTCLVCKTCFNTRLRLLAHLDDSRRSRCRDAILRDGDTYRKLDVDRVAELDMKDREDRKTVKRQGHSHPIAVLSATTAAGKRIGFVQS